VRTPDKPGELIASIGDTTTGRWMITTQTGSHYLVDLDARQLIRSPELFVMRRDHEPLHLYELSVCEAGCSAVFLVEVLDGGLTARITSPVMSIELLRDP